MECDDLSLVAQWTARWEGLIEFEVVPVITSAEARKRSHLGCEGRIQPSNGVLLSTAFRNHANVCDLFRRRRRPPSPALVPRAPSRARGEGCARWEDGRPRM